MDLEAEIDPGKRTHDPGFELPSFATSLKFHEKSLTTAQAGHLEGSLDHCKVSHSYKLKNLTA